ncbi:Predicted transcriptional regulator, ArsR family [Lentibacillus persicus]|uniref:Predicted transcriptional regulator, ArsR family n=1 Tax=Lentibacillus persicus TaxID=640948 RepID=A0A1I1TEL5_9BACI|nr:helix-turn-helix domain-containing protein [Lentibacillus persicus]SFD53940.1 Predicted transcriptional regulator, ArsR family [Lentibacillus persicus]
MEQTLKVTGVLSDPTRFNIYQYMIKHHQEVSVASIAKEFNIHPNVARLHLSKLEDIHMVESYSEKTGRGGRPSRLYKLSDEVIDLHFPHRDYKLLSSIALESFIELGEPGRQALYQTGYKYGAKMIEQYQRIPSINLNTEQKLKILEDAGTMLGMYPEFQYDAKDNSVSFQINNCPFKEIIDKNHAMVCRMHHAFIKGMFEALFDDIELMETENMFNGCENCSYVAKLSIV